MNGDKRSQQAVKADDALLANEKHVVGCLPQGIKRQIDKRSLYHREILEIPQGMLFSSWNSSSSSMVSILAPALLP